MTENILKRHSDAYPLLMPEDIFKFIYQSVFGCEHMVENSSYITEFIESEANNEDKNIIEKTEPLDGEYSRVHLGYIKKGLKSETLGKLFYLSASENSGNTDMLITKLQAAKKLSENGELPFSLETFNQRLKEWEDKNFPAIHHSKEFGKAYKPAYRVISNKYVRLIPLLTEIDKLSLNGQVILAVEGGSASGKTTLSGLLKKIYDCNIFHTDDFFLQPHQRTAERLAEPGGNLDRERFLSEVIIPLSEEKNVYYQPYDCSSGKLLPHVKAKSKRINIIEGAYSMHPDFSRYYNLSVFIEISKETQRERILKRNPDMAERFFNEWIPMEEEYRNYFKTEEKCDMNMSMHDGN